MWLRTIRAAERGQDGEIGIAGKSPPKPVAGPRSRPPSVSPRKTWFFIPPKSPSVPSSPGLLPLSSLVALYGQRHSPSQSLLPLGAAVHLFPAPYWRSPRKYPRSLSHPQDPDARTLPSLSSFSSSIPALVPASHPNLGHPHFLPWISQTPGSCPLDTGDPWESPNFLCLLLPHRWDFLLITFLPLPGETFQKDTSVLDSQHSPQQMPLPLLFSSPLFSSYFSPPEGEFF